MHLLLGMTPPPPIGTDFVFACIGLALTGYLAYRLSKRRPSQLGVILSGMIIIVTLGLCVILEVHHGALAFLGGGIGGAALFAGGANRERRRGHAGWLIGACLRIGPIVGIGLFGLKYLRTSPSEWEQFWVNDLITLLVFGTVAGLLGALLVAITVAVAE